MLSTIKEMDGKVNIFQKDCLTIKIYDDVRDMGNSAASEVSKKIKEILEEKGEVNIVFAAAPSQEEFLKFLIADKSIDWSRVNAFHMDEYIGMENFAPQSFGNFLKERIFGLLPFKSVNYINGKAQDLDKECERYSMLLKEKPVDIVCLGIGENGHIAFNDPDVADFNDSKSVKIVELDETCRCQQVNEKCFEKLEQVPRKALTMTVPALLEAEWMFCIVPFEKKAPAVRNTVFGEISEKCPASILRKKENSKLYLDKNSSSRLFATQ